MDSHAEASVELGAITRNIAALRAHVAPAAVMAVVKADGYGHGAVGVSRVLDAAGVDWLGVALLKPRRWVGFEPLRDIAP